MASLGIPVHPACIVTAMTSKAVTTNGLALDRMNNNAPIAEAVAIKNTGHRAISPIVPVMMSESHNQRKLSHKGQD